MVESNAENPFQSPMEDHSQLNSRDAEWSIEALAALIFTGILVCGAMFYLHPVLGFLGSIVIISTSARVAVRLAADRRRGVQDSEPVWLVWLKSFILMLVLLGFTVVVATVVGSISTYFLQAPPHGERGNWYALEVLVWATLFGATGGGLFYLIGFFLTLPRRSRDNSGVE